MNKLLLAAFFMLAATGCASTNGRDCLISLNDNCLMKQSVPYRAIPPPPPLPTPEGVKTWRA